MSDRSSASFAVGGVEPKFACVTCGSEVGGMFPLEVRGHCCKCAGEHPEYEYGYCIECGEEREYAPCDDDVGFGGGYSVGDPIGVPASAMNGNAMQAGSDSWNRWVAFCEANGHP